MRKRALQHSAGRPPLSLSILKGSEQLFASKCRSAHPTEAALIAEFERERRVIEQKQNGGDT